jgi:hypothetical protein
MELTLFVILALLDEMLLVFDAIEEVLLEMAPALEDIDAS